MDYKMHNLLPLEYLSNFYNNDYVFVNEKCIFRVFLTPEEIFSNNLNIKIFYEHINSLRNEENLDIKYENQQTVIKVNLNRKNHAIMLPLQSLIIKNKYTDHQIIVRPNIDNIKIQYYGEMTIFYITLSAWSIVSKIMEIVQNFHSGNMELNFNSSESVF